MFDAVDTQDLTPARGKEPAGPVLDKPGVFPFLRSSVLLVFLSAEFFIHIWTSSIVYTRISQVSILSHLCSALLGENE